MQLAILHYFIVYIVFQFLVLPYSATAKPTRPKWRAGESAIEGRDSIEDEPAFTSFLSRSRLQMRQNTDTADLIMSNVRRLDTSQNDQAKNEPIGQSFVDAIDEESVILENATAVSCYSGYLSVAVQKELMGAVYGQLTEDQFSFRDLSDPSCRATPRGSNRTHFILATLNSHCATSISTTASGRSIVQLIKNQVILRPTSQNTDTANSSDVSSPNSTLAVNITCSINLGSATNAPKRKWTTTIVSVPSAIEQVENRDFGTSNHSFRLTLSDKAWTGPDAETSWVKHPFEVVIGSRLYAQIQIVQCDDDLKAFAKECFYSKNSDPISEPKSMILTSGCAALNSVTLHYLKSPPENRYTRLSFLLERIYFDSNYMYFQCKVAACSLRGGREAEGYETCPNGSFCADRTIDSRYVPTESAYSYVSSGLMRPILRSEPSDDVVPATCPPCPSPDTIPSAPEPQHSPEIVVNGVPVAIVIGIGFGFFGLGFFMMGGIWWVRVHTDPKRILKHGYSDRDSSSFLPVPPESYAPVTKNGIRDEMVPIRTANA